MKSLLNLTDAIKTELTNNKLINSVTFGNIDEVELLKQDLYPLAHVGISTGTIGDSTSQIEVSVLFLDIVDVSKENEDEFNDSELYKLNNMLSAATKTTQELKRGNLYEQGYQVEEATFQGWLASNSPRWGPFGIWGPSPLVSFESSFCSIQGRAGPSI